MKYAPGNWKVGQIRLNHYWQLSGRENKNAFNIETKLFSRECQKEKENLKKINSLVCV